MAELFKGGSALPLGQARVLKARGVHDEQGTQRVLAGLQSTGTHTHTQSDQQKKSENQL